MTTDSLRQSMIVHLASWGLRRFTSDADYFAWQRAVLSAEDINRLHQHVERKRRGAEADEVAFYDAAADPTILPVLYSQRYDYCCEIGPRVVARIGDARTVLDVGCGVGLLTTFYASRFPDKTFVGVDRSPASIEQATSHAKALGLHNVQFECRDVARQPLSQPYDCIIATHVLLQAEQDAGLPSRDWTTFERAHDERAQRAFEQRTGLGVRLDALRAALASGGRMIVFEKTRQLARRIPLQRALASRGLGLLEQPEPIRYHLVEEAADDGPFYVLKKGPAVVAWNEEPEPDAGGSWESGICAPASGVRDQPLYENHWPSAQRAWERLEDKRVAKQSTRQASDGRQMHVELGMTRAYPYLYGANTFDQRQLVVMGEGGGGMLEQYYEDILSQPV